MRKYLAVLLLLPSLVFAAPAPISFDFADVSLVTFAEATYKSILGRDYVISPDIVSSDKKISISVKNMDVAQVPGFLENILGKQGIVVSERQGIIYLDPYSDPVKPVDMVNGAKSQSVNLESLVSGQDGKIKDGSKKNDLDNIDMNESRVFKPQNRPAELLLEAINAGYGPKSAQLVGDRLLVTATHAKLDKIFALIGDLDYEPKRIEVSASWIEISDTTGSGLGISIASSVLGRKFSASLGTTNSGSQLSLTGTSFQLVIDALNTDSRFKDVSNSRMLGNDREKISLIVGDETPTVSSTSTNTAGNPVQNIVYRPSGVIVEVTPQMLGNGKINLTIDGEISSFQSTTTGVAGSPTLIKRQVKTGVTVADGEVLLIGGLNDTQSTKSTSGWAFLPASWMAKSDTGVKTDLVLVLSAKVANEVAQK